MLQRENQYWRQTIESLMPAVQGGRKRLPFFVNPAASGSSHGLDYYQPVKTLQEAIDLCENGVGDVIYVLPGAHDITTTVNFNKRGIIVKALRTGVAEEAGGEYFSLLANASFVDGPVATITQRCYIEGLSFISRDTGATFYSGAALLIGGLATASPFGVHIRKCRFPKWGLDNRIGIGIEGSSDCTIEECTFEGVGASFDSGIYVQGACQNLNILRNKFRQCTYAITHGAFAGDGPHAIYGHNVCEDSKLLDSGGNAATGLLYDNWLETATDTGSYDGSVATLQGYGLNFSGNHYSE